MPRLGGVGQGVGEFALVARDGKGLDLDDLTATDANEGVGASRSEGSAFADGFVVGDVGSPSIANGRKRGGGTSGAFGEVDAGQLASGTLHDGGNNAVSIERDGEVDEVGGGAEGAVVVDVDTLRLVIEHEQIVVDAVVDAGGIHASRGEGEVARENLLGAVFGDVDGGGGIHQDEVDVVARAIPTALRAFVEDRFETGRGYRDEFDAIEFGDLEGDLVVEFGFDVEPLGDFAGLLQRVEERGGAERDAAFGADFVVVEPLFAIHEGGVGGGGDVALDDVAEVVGADIREEFREGIGVDFGNDDGATDFGGAGTDGEAIGFLVIHHFDGVDGATVLGEFALFPSKGSGGFLVTAFNGGEGIGKETFGRASLDVVAGIVGEATKGDLRDFDAFGVL